VPFLKYVPLLDKTTNKKKKKTRSLPHNLHPPDVEIKENEHQSTPVLSHEKRVED
jgi:hypothetical protein